MSISQLDLLTVPEEDLHWRVMNFRDAWRLYYSVGNVIESHMLRMLHDWEYVDWCLHLYPKGFSEENANYLLIYLKLCRCQSSLLRIECMCTIKYSQDKSTRRRSFNNFTRVEERFLCMKIKTSDVIENLKGSDLRIAVNVKIWFSEKANKLPIASQIERYQYTDVRIKVGTKIIHAHKKVLIAQSPVFAAMFSHNTKESKENCIEVADIDYVVLEQTIMFMYRGTVKNLDALAEEYLYSAEKYDVVALKSMCEDHYIKMMTIDNVIDILTLADFYSADKLRNNAIRFIVLHIKDLIDKDEFRFMARSHPVILEKIRRLTLLSHDFKIREASIKHHEMSTFAFKTIRSLS